jgi:hypothetical protein
MRNFRQSTRLWSQMPATQIEVVGHGLFWEATLREVYADRGHFTIDHQFAMAVDSPTGNCSRRGETSSSLALGRITLDIGLSLNR